MKKLVALLLSLTLVLSLAACGKDEPEVVETDVVDPGSETTDPATTDGTVDTDYDTVEIEAFEGGEVRVYVTFNGEKFITYNESSPWTAPDGVTYKKGDLLPTWSYLEEKIGITITDATPKSGAKDAELLEQAAATKFEDANLFMGSPRTLSNYGIQGYFLPINQYLDRMPNFSAFLDANPAVRSSLTQADGNIYLTPYFDDIDQLERMFLMRLDWVMKLLDEEGTYDTAKTINTVYEPVYDYAGGKTIKIGSDVKTFNIAENIVTIQNNLEVKNGATLVQALKDYIDANYDYAKRSDFFISPEAAYDADELIALMRAVKANPVYLTGEDKDLTVFSQRNANKVGDTISVKYLLAIWGIQGTDSENGYYYFDDNENLVEARIQEDYLDGLENLNKLYQEGLILKDYDQPKGQVTDWRALNFQTNDGFMTYDYAASTVAQHDQVPAEDLERFGTIFEPVVSAAAPWFSSEFMHFMESQRSVKTAGGWGVTTATADDDLILESALRLMDYPFSADGLEVMTFGPQGLYWNERIEFAGKMIPSLLDTFAADSGTYAGGNWSNFMRGFIGATFGVGHVKQTIAIEMQVSNEHYANGIQRISDSNTMINSLAADAAPATKVVPTLFPLDEDQIEALSTNSFGSYYDEWQSRIIKHGFGAKIPNSTDVVPTRDEFVAELEAKGIVLEAEIMNQAYQSTK